MVSVLLNIMCSNIWGRPVLPLGASWAPTGCIKAKETTGTPGRSKTNTVKPFLRTFSTTGKLKDEDGVWAKATIGKKHSDRPNIFNFMGFSWDKAGQKSTRGGAKKVGGIIDIKKPLFAKGRKGLLLVLRINGKRLCPLGRNWSRKKRRFYRS